MTATLIDGKATGAVLRDRVAEAAEAFGKQAGRPPGLRVILVGDDPASQTYVASKEKVGRGLGLDSRVERYPADLAETDLLRRIAALNADPAIDGILVQLPLPPQIDPQRVIAAIDPDKDVDGLHPVNVGRLVAGLPGALVPCTPFGCWILLRQILGTDRLDGRTAFVLGRSNLVGKPMAQLLLAANATVTVGHSRTAGPAAMARRADILVAAVGRPGLVTADWVKPGATVIDVGISRLPKPDGGYRLAGDLDFDAAREVAGAITPVPGGVGPMTIAVLLRNTVVAATRRTGIAVPDPVDLLLRAAVG